MGSSLRLDLGGLQVVQSEKWKCDTLWTMQYTNHCNEPRLTLTHVTLYNNKLRMTFHFF